MKQTLSRESKKFPPESTQIPEKTRKNYPLYALFVLLAVTILNEIDNSVFASTSTDIARDLHLGINDLGFLASAFTIAVTLSIIPVGIWADRAKRKHVIAACLAVWSLATTCTGLTGNFLALFLTRTVVGSGEAGYAPTSNALVGDLFGTASRAKVLSWLAVSRIVGIVLGLITGGIIADLYTGSWRLAFLVAGIPGLLLVLAVWRLPEPVRHPADMKREGSSSFRGNARQIFSNFWALSGIKTLIILIAMGILEAFALTSLTTFISPLLHQKDAFGLSSGQTGLFTGLGLGVSGVPGVLLGGYLADRLNRRYQGARVLVCGLSLLLAAPLSLAMILVAGTHNLNLFTVLFLATLFVDGAHAGSLAAARLDVVPALMRGSAVASAILLNRILGSALAPTLVGSLARSFDPGGQHFQQLLAGHDLIQALAWTCPVAFLAAGVVGIIGLLWVEHDRVAAEQADKQLDDTNGRH